MARPLSKTLTTTRVAYKTVEVVDGVPQSVDRPDAVFSGILEKERVERMLRGQLGKDAIIVVTNVDSGQHRYEMDLETFVLNARIADGETEDSPDENPDTNSGDNSDDDPNSAADFLPDPAPNPDATPGPVSEEDDDEPEPAADAGAGGGEEDEDGEMPF